jgi:hypothetical protein
MPRDDNRNQAQKAPTKLGNEGKTTVKVHPSGSQVQKANEPMKPSEDIWQSFSTTKRTMI